MNVSLEGLTPEQINDLAALSLTLGTNKDTKLAFQKLAKVANPQASAPELELHENMVKLAHAGKAEIDSLKHKILQQEVMQRIKDERDALVKTGIASESDLPEIEKLMTERGIADHKTAAEFYRMQQQLATPGPGVSETTLMNGDVMDLMKAGKSQRAMSQWTKKTLSDALGIH